MGFLSDFKEIGGKSNKKSLIWHSFYDKSFSKSVRYEVFIL